MTTTPPRIDPRLGAAALRAPAASREDSRPQAILKFQPRNSFDYRVRYEPQLAGHVDHLSYSVEGQKTISSQILQLILVALLFSLR